MVDNPVGTVGTVAEAVAVKVKGAVIAPIVAATTLAPIKETGADVFDLAFVVDKRIIEQACAFNGRGKVNTDLTVFKMVVENFIVVGIVGKHAFACLVYHIIVNFGIIDVVEHNALVAAANGNVAIHFQAFGKHQHITHVVADGDIVADFAVIGVHIMDGKA